MSKETTFEHQSYLRGKTILLENLMKHFQCDVQERVFGAGVTTSVWAT